MPTEESAQLALRTQQIIAHESGIPDVVDPLSGSKYVEALTDELEKSAFKLINKIEEYGGAVDAIEDEYQQNKIASSAYDYQKNIDNQESILVGVNKYRTCGEEKIETQLIDENAITNQLNQLKKNKQNRSNKAVSSALLSLKIAASTKKNLIIS